MSVKAKTPRMGSIAAGWIEVATAVWADQATLCPGRVVSVKAPATEGWMTAIK